MIPRFLADFASPSPANVGIWVGVYAAIIVAVYYTLEVVNKIRGGATEIKPQPFIVKEHESAASRADQEKLEKKIDAADAWARSSRKGIYEKIEDHGSRIKSLEQGAGRTVELEKKIDANTIITAETRGKVDQINQSVQNLTGSLTNFLRDQAKR